MRVLHVIPSISYKLGGPTEAVLNLVRHSRHLGIDAEIATTNDDVNGLLDVPLKECFPYEGVPVWFFPYIVRLKAYLPSISLSSWLVRRVKDYDIVHNHYLFCCAPTVAGITAYLHKTTYISRTIGQLAPWALSQSALKKRVYSNFIERPILNRASAIHCTTAAEAQDATDFGVTSPKMVLPLGVNLPEIIPAARTQLRQRYHLSQDCQVILFLSRLHEKKRPDFLLEVFACLAHQNRPLHLLLAGSGEQYYSQYLHEQVQRLGIAGRITFTGFISGFDKSLLLQGADLFALPSYSENFGIAVVEALAASLPVVITPDVQIAPAIESAGAGLVVPGSLNDWEKSLTTLLNSSELRKNLGCNGKRLAENLYSWPAIAKQLAQSYEELLLGKPLSTAHQPLCI